MESSTAAYRDWGTNLFPEILNMIAEKIDSYADFIMFGSVCKSWHLASTLAKPPGSSPNLPLFMSKKGTETKIHTNYGKIELRVDHRTFYNIFSSKSFNIKLPEAHGKSCYPVNFGWLLMLSWDGKIELLHPFSGRQIVLASYQCLLPHSGFQVAYDRGYSMNGSYLTKAVLSCSPNDQNECLVFIIYGKRRLLAFTKVGDVFWTPLGTVTATTYYDLSESVFEDIVYREGQLHAVDRHGCVFAYEVHNYMDGVPFFVKPPPLAPSPDVTRKWFDYHKYLVHDLDGNLLLAYRDYIRDGSFADCYHGDFSTKRFITFRLQTTTINVDAEYSYLWVKVVSIGNQALFLGLNSSVSLVSNNRIKSNCIYFSEDHLRDSGCLGGGYDLGIFDIQDKSIQRPEPFSRFGAEAGPIWYI